jgi:diguanylate cyclase (GGDEF)-like protein/PAS domain S-box-containing protein
MLHILLVFILVTGGLASLGLSAYSWRRRAASQSAVLYCALSLCVAIYAVGYGAELMNTRVETILWCIRLEYLGIVNIPALWLCLALFYTNQVEWLKPRRLALLWAVPLLVLTALYTNDAFHLFYAWEGVRMGQPFPTFVFERGPIYWVHQGFSLFSYLVGTGLLARQIAFPHPIYRRQVVLMLVASLVTIALTGIYVTGLIPVTGLDIVPFAMLSSTLVIGWGILNFRMSDLSPAARTILFENSLDGVLLFDHGNQLVDFNPAAAGILSIPADAIGRAIETFLPPATCELIASLKTGGPALETTAGASCAPAAGLADRPASRRFFDVYAIPVALRWRGNAGRMVIFHDTTPRKETEALIRQSETRYRLLAENSTDVIWTMDIGGHFTYVSPSVVNLRGFTPEEIFQQTLEEAISPGSLELVMRSIQRAYEMAATREPFPPEYLEIEQPCKGGGSVWTEATAHPILDDQGQLIGIVGISRDISARKRIQDQLRASMDELVRFNQVMVGRETRMIELKREINALLEQNNQAPRYALPSDLEEWLEEAVMIQDEPPGTDQLLIFDQQVRSSLANEAKDMKEGRRAALNLALEAQSARKEAEVAYEKLQVQMAEITALQEQLHEQAIRDPLTGCYNRRYLEETLSREFSRAHREGYPLSLVMVDIDHFKSINDTHGHRAGDVILQALGVLLRGRTRAGDIVCRYGGEEFLIVVLNIDEEAVLGRADRLRLEFEEMRIHYGELELSATISAGVACCPVHGENPEEVLHAADRAMYQAKRDGRNCVRSPRQ